jgi:hypothetical protein
LTVPPNAIVEFPFEVATTAPVSRTLSPKLCEPTVVTFAARFVVPPAFVTSPARGVVPPTTAAKFVVPVVLTVRD